MNGLTLTDIESEKIADLGPVSRVASGGAEICQRKYRMGNVRE
jgi:hypothetical protein